METFFSNNMKLLRKRKKLSQEDMAAAVNLKRHDIDNYERGIVPRPENLVLIADFLKISIDTLLRNDLSKFSEYTLKQLEQGNDSYVKGTKLRVHATTVDSNNNENVELVSHKAKAGYTEGYNDPEFVSGLPTFQLPFLSRERKYRMFQIDGDSMLPIPDKSYIVAEFLRDWSEMQDGHAYIILTKDEGIVFKIAYNQIRKKKNLLLKSLNSQYKPYEVDITDIKEVWKFVNYTASKLPESINSQELLLEKISELQKLIVTT